MDEVEILEKIIAENGNCDWIIKMKSNICESCPLSRLKQRDGRYISCVEALGADRLPQDEVDAKYKEVAQKLLLDLTIEKVLKDD